MGYWDYPYFPPSKPKEAKGGIKLSSTRGAITATWWGQRWLSTLEGFYIGTRLARGKSYARGGQVTELKIGVGKVSAMVQGSRPYPYEVEILFKPYNDEQWTRILERLNENPLWTAQLLNGTMPPEIETVFTELKLPLFPERMKDIETECSCPDWSNPCKHLAAVYYILAEAFDRDPLVLFELRGRTRKQIMEHLQGGTYVVSSEDLTPLPPESLPLDVVGFWGTQISRQFIPPQPCSLHATIPKRLGKISFWRSSTNLLEWMEKRYRIAVSHALEIVERTAAPPPKKIPE